MPNDARAIAPISLAERRQLQQLYEQARQHMQRPGYDTLAVHEWLANCLERDPGNVYYADAMLINLRNKFQGKPSNTPRVSIFTGKNSLKKAATEQRWPAVLAESPNVLQHNPWDAEVLMWTAQACAGLGHEQAGLFFLRHALENQPRSAELHRMLAQTLTRIGRFDEAIASWQQLEAIDPFDEDAPRMIASLTLEKTRTATSTTAPEANVTAHGPPQDSHTTSDGQVISQNAKPTPGARGPLTLSRRQELELAIKDCPENEDNYLALAELYLAEDRTFDAERTLLKAMQVSRDLRVLERLEDVNLLRAKEKVDIARQQAIAEPTPEARELAERLLDEQKRLELEVYRTRCERYPQNPELKYQFGVRLVDVGNYREAVDWLQAGLELPAHRASASLAIGECLQRFQLFPKALQCYRQAAQLAATAPDQFDCRRRALYRAGLLAEAMQLPDSARQYLNELVRIAPDYKDARSRLDKLLLLDNNA